MTSTASRPETSPAAAAATENTVARRYRRMRGEGVLRVVGPSTAVTPTTSAAT
ncbi:hypothetical protein AB0B45_10080 [Nonomuraea sp. NPDC049152]|uniref:hypothetical protein n=1 Tax=Nonomuraea sp. NPDC049152 TaxID=3154350 RepID=UPI0033C2205B